MTFSSTTPVAAITDKQRTRSCVILSLLVGYLTNIMSVRRFEGKEHAEAYKKYRPVFKEDLYVTIMDYVRNSPIAEEYSVSLLNLFC